MDKMSKFEDTVGLWHDKLPHLSDRTRGWVADNSWWLTLVIVAVGIAGIVVVLSMSLLASLVLMGMAGIVGAAAGSVILMFVALAMILTVANAVLLALAIGPLKQKEYKGWRLAFVAVLLNLAGAIAKVLYDFKPGALVMSLLVSVLAAYLLYEIRERFARVSVTARLSSSDVKS